MTERIHLVDLLDESELTAPQRSFIELQHFVINNDPRLVVFMHPPAALKTPEFVALQDNPVVSFGAGIHKAVWDRMQGAVGFQIFLLRSYAGAEELQIWQLTLSPQNYQHRSWFDDTLSLHVARGEKFRLLFETYVPNDQPVSFAWVGWSHPVLKGAVCPQLPPPRRVTTTHSRPNVLLITADALRFDKIASSSVETPHLDALRQDSYWYNHCRSSHVNTTGAYASLLTGRYARELGTVTEYDGLPAYFRSLPLSLAEQGYRTFFLPSKHDTGAAYTGFSALFHKTLLGRGNPGQDGAVTARRFLRELDSMPLDRPFFSWLEFFDVHPPALVPLRFFREPETTNHRRDAAAIKRIRGIEALLLLQITTEDIAQGQWPLLIDDLLKKTAASLQGARVMATDVAEALQSAPNTLLQGMDLYALGGWLEAERRACVSSRGITEPMRIWLAALEEFLSTSEKTILPWGEGFDDIDFPRRSYEASVRYLDAQIGFVLEGLKSRDLYKDTIIIFTSPHGNLLGEKGMIYHHHLDDEAVWRVPLIVRLPTNIRPSKLPSVINSQVSLLDLYPSLSELIGFHKPADLPGELLWSAQGAEPNPENQRVICGDDYLLRSAVACQGNFKLLRHYHDGPTGAYYVKAGEESFL
ncbi:MAG: sulfatase-like hydrolase/transferase, partial [Verrucomicrobiales bacterium]